MINRKTIKDVLDLALPAVGEMILYMMIWVFDTLMVGQYGGNIAVSTVGLSSEILYTFSNIFISVGVSVGIASLVARRIGANEFDLAEEYASVGFITGGVIAFLIFLTAFTLCGKILTIAGAKGEVINSGIIFMRIASVGIFFNMIMNTLNSILRGYGNTKTPLLISLLINVINLGMDWLLIFGNLGFPELGVRGAAIATTSANIIGFIFITYYMSKKSVIKPRLRYIKKLNFNKLKELLKLCIPSSLQQGAFDISRLLCVFMIMHLGTIAFASNQIATTIESVSFMPGWGFAIAATTLVGHRIGEKNFVQAREYAYACMTLGSIIMFFCSLLFLICPNFLIHLFINESEKQVIYLGSLCLMVASVEQIPMAISMILGGSLKGLGDTKTPFIISLISSWVIRLPLMFYLIYIAKLAVFYIWWATAIQWIFEGIVIFIAFKRKFGTLILKETS